MFSYRCMEDLKVENKTVLVRVDFNLPLSRSGEVGNTYRLEVALPTIKYLIQSRAKVLLLSHFGRPGGKVEPHLSLRRLLPLIRSALRMPIAFCEDMDSLVETATALKPGEVLLVENLRFYPEEENPNPEGAFLKVFHQVGDYLVNEAFAAAHRFHGVNYALAQKLQPHVALGMHFCKELQAFESLSHPEGFFALIGGGKIKTKIPLIKALLPRLKGLCIGGAMAHHFLKVQGCELGGSMYQKDYLQEAEKILVLADVHQVKLFLPVDVTCLEKGKEVQVLELDQGLKAFHQACDIGPATVKLFKNALQQASSIFWNGPLGKYEDPRFQRSTLEIAKWLKTLAAFRVIGGGDTLAALPREDYQAYDHLSTGGGAGLKLLEKQVFPSLKPYLLEDFREGK